MAKKKAPRLNSPEAVNEVLHAMAKLQAGFKKREVEYNKELLQLKKKYEEDTEVDTAAYKELEKEVKAYCNYFKNKPETMGIEKVVYGKFGWRINPKKVSLLSGKWDENKVVKKAKELFKLKFIHVDETFNKELAIQLDDRGKLSDEDKLAMGIKITKGKTFVCEPDWKKIKDKERK